MAGGLVGRGAAGHVPDAVGPGGGASAEGGEAACPERGPRARVGADYRQHIERYHGQEPPLWQVYDPSQSPPARHGSFRPPPCLQQFDSPLGQTALWDTWDHRFKLMAAAKSLGAPIDYLGESSSLLFEAHLAGFTQGAFWPSAALHQAKVS